MAGINNIDYSNWSNNKAVEYAKQVDTDGVKGLQGHEIFNFARTAAASMEKAEIYELLGLSVSQTRSSSRAANVSSRPSNPDFDAAVDFYNTKLPARTWLMFDSEVSELERHKITENAKDNCKGKLYNIESEIIQAKADCIAFQDPELMVVSDYWYRGYYHRIYDKGIDIAKLRTDTEADMEAIYTFKDTVERIFEKAEGKGDDEHQKPKKTEYNVDAIAEKYFAPLSYEEFANQYYDELEYCKTVTLASMHTMTERQAYVYIKIKPYAEEMLSITMNEVFGARFDAEERLMYETFDATDDMFDLEDFEYDGITEDGLNEIQSGIMYKAFEEALISKHQELDPTGVENVKAEDKQQQPKKVVVNGAVLIFNPDGSVVDTAGRKIK